MTRLAWLALGAAGAIVAVLAVWWAVFEAGWRIWRPAEPELGLGYDRQLLLDRLRRGGMGRG